MLHKPQLTPDKKEKKKENWEVKESIKTLSQTL